MFKSEAEVAYDLNWLLLLGSGLCTRYVDGNYISGDGLRLLPHLLLRRWKALKRLRVGSIIPAGSETDGIQDQWGHGSRVGEEELLIFI